MIRSMLLLINLSNDYVHDEGKFNVCKEQIHGREILNQANEAILWSRRHQIPVMHMTTAFHENYIDFPTHSPIFKRVKEEGALKVGSWGCQLHDEILQESSDTHLHKHRVSCFYGTELEQILQTQQINTLLIGGVSTHEDIALAVREAHDRDLYSIVLQDICADKNDALHLLALESIGHYTKVRTLEDLKQSPR